MILAKRSYKNENIDINRKNVYEGVIMQKERFSFAVNKETQKEFHKIMEFLGSKNKNQTFTVVVSTYMKKHVESELYRKIKEDIQAYDVLWEMKLGDDDSVRR